MFLRAIDLYRQNVHLHLQLQLGVSTPKREILERCKLLLRFEGDTANEIHILAKTRLEERWSFGLDRIHGLQCFSRCKEDRGLGFEWGR